MISDNPALDEALEVVRQEQMRWLPPLKLGGGQDDRVLLGVDSRERPFSLPISDPKAGALCWLIAGAPGAGKSNTLSVVIRDVARRPNHALVLADPKMVEFGPWAKRASCIALGTTDREGEVNYQLQLLELLEDELHRRYRKMEAGEGYSRKWRVGIDGPRLVVVFDELAAITTGLKGTLRDVIIGRMGRLMTMGRAAEIVVIVCTQQPDAQVIPTRLRNACQIRIAHMTMSGDQTEMILNTSRPAGVPILPHQLPPSARGVGYALTDTSPQVEMFKAARLEDDEIVACGEVTAPLCVTLDGWPRRLSESVRPGGLGG
jgi:DNA segregation ATPase FtsK/SpoIIIE-like protein